MANDEHLAILQKGVPAWNQWRKDQPEVIPDLRRAYLRKLDLSGANFAGADLGKATLSKANLSNAILNNASLYGAYLREANLSNASLRNAKLRHANFADVNIEGADLSGSSVYGISVWGLQGTPAGQSNLVVSRQRESRITVDNLEVAQFVYLLLNNEKVRDVINTIGKKAVLILGRFTPERKVILKAISEELRSLDLVPIIFDFEKSQERDFTETIKILAGLSLFIIADITNPKSAPLELQAVVPDYSIPLVPILQMDERPFSMFADLYQKYHWVLPVVGYTAGNIVAGLSAYVIQPALAKHKELVARRTVPVQIINISNISM